MAVIAFVAAAVAGVLIVVARPGAYLALTFSLAAMLMSLTVFEWLRCGHPLSPAGIAGLGGLLIFVVRPLTVRSTEVTTAGAALDSQSVTHEVLAAGAVALCQLNLFAAFLGLGFFVWLYRPLSPNSREVRLVGSDQVHRAGMLLGVCLALVLATSGVLIRDAGGVGAYLDGLATRSSFLAGRYLLTLGYLPASVVLCVYLALRQGRPNLKVWTPFVWFAIGVTAVGAFAGGGRGPLLLGVIVPLLIIKQGGPRPFRTPSLVLLGVLVVVGGMVMSILLRDNVYTEGRAASDLRSDPIAALGSRLTDGSETRPFDSLIVLNRADARDALEPQMGRTYAATVRWFLPSATSGQKGGGNTWFTKTYVPRYYYPDKIETSISAPGEAYANFGWVGLLMSGGLLGIAAAAFSRSLENRSGLGLALNAKLAPMFFSFLRGDAYQNLSLGALIAVGVLVVFMLCRSERLSGARGCAAAGAHPRRAGVSDAPVR